jgi:hypothetical protein
VNSPQIVRQSIHRSDPIPLLNCIRNHHRAKELRFRMDPP